MATFYLYLLFIIVLVTGPLITIHGFFDSDKFEIIFGVAYSFIVVACLLIGIGII